MKPKLIKKSKYQPTTGVNFFKANSIQKLLQYTSYSEKIYALIEVICKATKHTHLKGLKGGICVSIDQDLKELDEIKSYLIEQNKTLRGSLIEIFLKSVQPGPSFGESTN